MGKLHIGARPDKETDLVLVCISFTQDTDGYLVANADELIAEVAKQD